MARPKSASTKSKWSPDRDGLYLHLADDIAGKAPDLFRLRWATCGALLHARAGRLDAALAMRELVPRAMLEVRVDESFDAALAGDLAAHKKLDEARTLIELPASSMRDALAAAEVARGGDAARAAAMFEAARAGTQSRRCATRIEAVREAWLRNISPEETAAAAASTAEEFAGPSLPAALVRVLPPAAKPLEQNTFEWLPVSAFASYVAGLDWPALAPSIETAVRQAPEQGASAAMAAALAAAKGDLPRRDAWLTEAVERLNGAAPTLFQEITRSMRRWLADVSVPFAIVKLMSASYRQFSAPWLAAGAVDIGDYALAHAAIKLSPPGAAGDATVIALQAAEGAPVAQRGVGSGRDGAWTP